LHAHLDALGVGHLATVLKIETRQGFENLPRILLAGLRRPPFGIMVARGDLAVEIGFERLAEVQEEILWLCEAAHVPVIWATQVLDTMARRGMPSRAEVSDAALSVRAECVMLNKGPYIVETLRFLDDILARMAAHRAKGLPMLRKLAVSEMHAGRGKVNRARAASIEV
jgi:pyruvate kinase